MVNDCILRMEGIEFGYDAQRPVLRGLHLALHAGQRIGLTGANGCGKSTLLHLAVGLLRPRKGVIEAFGAPCRTERDFVAVRRRVGLLFQDPNDQLFCPTVLEETAFGPLNLGMSPEDAKRRALETLEALDFSDRAHRITHHLSEGEKHLVALAGVLAMRPDALLLDEPSAGLDDRATERIIRVLRELPQALLVVSHQRDFLDEVVDETWSMAELQADDEAG